MCFKNSSLNLGYFLKFPLKISNFSFSNLIPAAPAPGLSHVDASLSVLFLLMNISTLLQVLLYASSVVAI